MDFKGLVKKQNIGTWISLAAVVLSIIALIIYGSAIKAGHLLEIANGSQPFYDPSRIEDSAMMATVVPCGIIAIIALVGAIVLEQFKFEGILGKILNVVDDVLRVLVPVLLGIATLYFLYGSFTGIGWTFFSNEELQIYETAIAVGNKVITGLVFFGLALVTSIVAPYFNVTKKEA